MPTYNERLQANNNSLEKLVTDVNALPDKKPEQTYDKTYTVNGSYPITPDSGKVITGGTIKVSVPSKLPVIKPITITKNGTTTAPAGTDGYSPITVNVPTSGGGKPISVSLYMTTPPPFGESATYTEGKNFKTCIIDEFGDGSFTTTSGEFVVVPYEPSVIRPAGAAVAKRGPANSYLVKLFGDVYLSDEV